MLINHNRIWGVLGLIIVSGVSFAEFLPAVRVDQENRPNYACYHADVAVGPVIAGTPVIYVAFEDDSVPFTVQRSDIAFQRSTDGGRTWLSENIIIRRGNRFACYPELVVGRDGTIYLMYIDRIDGSRGHIHFVRSTDMGETWSDPVQVDDNTGTVPIGWVKLALDSSENIFCSWTDQRSAYLRVYADVSTDGGRTWGRDVRVDDDTVSFNCYPPDVFVQPGTNDYLVVADAPVREGSGIVLHSHFYRSTDQGRSFSPGFQLDTFSGYSRMPHVVADEQHIITDYTGNGYVNQCKTLARTWYADGDTWGEQVLVTELDTIYSSFTQGAKLAIDPIGVVHTALMFAHRESTIWNIYYTYSTDHGRTWAQREAVSPMAMVQQWDPSIAVDQEGTVCIVWQDMREGKAEIWFSTNRLTSVTESDASAPGLKIECMPTVFRSRSYFNISGKLDENAIVKIYDLSGKTVRSLRICEGRGFWDGCDDAGKRLNAGVYLLRAGTAGVRLLLLP
ncbi:MAG: exo-alpha-sialidase [candidate division WOR-3 bacterium]